MLGVLSGSVMAALLCPHCGEPIETFPDPGGGEEQEYIEDCSVCCRPILLHATLDPDGGEFTVNASANI